MSTSLYGNSNSVTMLSDNGYESDAILLLRDDTLEGDQRIVRKIYNKRYYDMLKEYRTHGEIYWYLQRPVPWMPRLVRRGVRVDWSLGFRSSFFDEQNEFIDVAYAGRPVQKDGGYIHVPDLMQFAQWLDDLESALQAAGVNHGDIHGENILVDEQGNFSLIDWTLASYGLNPKRVEREPILGDDSKQFAVWRKCLENVGIKAG